MSIVQITTDFAGQIGVNPRLVRIVSTDTYSVVTSVGYLNNVEKEGYNIEPTDFIFMNYNSGANFGIFTPVITSGSVTLSPYIGQGNVILPVVSGDFAVFSGTTGAIADDGYLPTNASLTNVVMSSGAITLNHVAKFADTNGTIEDGGVLGTAASKAASNNSDATVASVAGSVILNHIATYADTSGTITDDAATAINGGNIQAGLSGTAGTLISYPATATKGSLQVVAVSNTGNTVTTISNAAMGQASVISIPDPGTATADFAIAPTALVGGNLIEASGTAGLIIDGGIAANKVLTSSITNPDTSIDLVRFDVTVGFAALATAGKVNLYVSSAAKQYKIVNLWANLVGTNFSGGGGDRLLAISDATNVYSIIPAADLQTLVNSGWGTTALPYPVSVSINTSTVAGATLFVQYSGGTTDYTAGSIVISGMLQRVA